MSVDMSAHVGSDVSMVFYSPLTRANMKKQPLNLTYNNPMFRFKTRVGNTGTASSGNDREFRHLCAHVNAVDAPWNLLLFKHANSDLDSNLAYFLNQLQLAHTIFCHSSLSTVTYYKKGLIVQDFSSPRRGHHALLRAWLVVLKKAENLN